MTDLGWAASSESPKRAAAHFRAALKRDPTSQSARFGLLAMRRRAVEANDPEVSELAEPLEGAASAVVSGWRLAAAGEWPALRELEPELASAEGLDPAYQDAQRLRVRWRTASDDPALHAEAVEIARELLRSSALPEDLIIGAKAFAVANQGEGALQLLDSLSKRRRKSPAAGGCRSRTDRLTPPGGRPSSTGGDSRSAHSKASRPFAKGSPRFRRTVADARCMLRKKKPVIAGSEREPSDEAPETHSTLKHYWPNSLKAHGLPILGGKRKDGSDCVAGHRQSECCLVPVLTLYTGPGLRLDPFRLLPVFPSAFITSGATPAKNSSMNSRQVTIR